MLLVGSADKCCCLLMFVVCGVLSGFAVLFDCCCMVCVCRVLFVERCALFVVWCSCCSVLSVVYCGLVRCWLRVVWCLRVVAVVACLL